MDHATRPVTGLLRSSVLVSAALLAACSGTDKQAVSATESGNVDTPPSKNIEIWPQLAIPGQNDPAIEQQVASLLAQMTLEQKVAQMIQPEIRDFTVEDMRKYGFGSYLNGGGAFPNNDKHATPADWIALAEAMYQASMDDSEDGIAIPTMWGTDAVHGHNNVIGATLFPHNIGLGAARNPALIEQIAAITAKEVMATGIDWVFAPTVAVVEDDRWGRTYESYAEDPAVVRDYSRAIVEGLQGRFDQDFLSDQRVVSTVKHFLGDGGTEFGEDQGNNLSSEQKLFDIHAQGYVGGLTAGAQTVMASFNSWHGKKIHGDEYLLTDVLKTRMGFDGLVVGDWNGHGQIAGCRNDSCPQAINAGLDIFMVPTDAWKPLYYNTIEQVRNGEISQARIDDAVSRILRVKFRAGLFDKPSPANRPLSGRTELIGHADHRAVARQAVRESLVLLKNNDQLLPLKPGQTVLVAGDGADNIGKQSGGWSITWQGTGNQNSDFPGGSSIYDGINEVVQASGGRTLLRPDGLFDAAEQPDVAIVVFGEDPYAEGNGDIDNLEYQRGDKRDLALLQSLQAQGIPVVSLFISGRPLWVNPEFNASDAFVAVWLPGTEGAGVADVLFTDAQGAVRYDFHGTLPFSWPATPQQAVVNFYDDRETPLLPYGFGLKYGQPSTLANDLSEDSGYDASLLAPRPLFQQGVKDPWHMVIGTLAGDNLDAEAITSNVQSHGSVAIRTIDRVIQEDARRVVFDGKGNGIVSLQGNFPVDLRAFSEANGRLSVEVKADAPLTQPLQLSMLSEEGVRRGIDIAPQLKGTEWTTVTVDLHCFAEQGINLARVFSPFGLSSQAAAKLSFGEVLLLPGSEQPATLTCPQ
ncbi:glycoside hydrolase family 3 protein [Ferrimonas marina]|uniref:Exo-1,4-beta-glucosidase n=1 Tax=Ferrimonas marina TaxID=299255 RepID=A0A1M5MFE0_9GAMM|nr:exo 1,3/1,4-beta-D-glucan glucohydrolase [Ferrimonas marina]SHG76088.1 exo-1,4-beta-glucosidase [Ferrimonas marina]